MIKKFTIALLTLAAVASSGVLGYWAGQARPHVYWRTTELAANN